MTPHRRLLAVVLVLFLGAIATRSEPSSNPRFGTWKLDPAKSEYEGPAAPPKARTVTIQPAGDGEKTLSETVLPDGTTRTAEFTANYDGKDYPVVGSPQVDTVALRRVDLNTIERTDKKGGQPFATFKIVVSPDGKTMTVSASGATQNNPWSLVEVYDRQ